MGEIQVDLEKSNRRMLARIVQELEAKQVWQVPLLCYGLVRKGGVSKHPEICLRRGQRDGDANANQNSTFAFH